MAKKMTSVPFKGTKEQELALADVIAAHRDMPGALMPVLQKAQDIYGYLPEEVQLMIAEGLNLSMAEVYGVITFYAQFSLNPKGKCKINVCLGTACYVKGAGDIIARVERALGIKNGDITPDGKFSLDATRCVGACGLAPIMTVNDEVYGKIVADDVDKIMAKYIN